MLSLTVTGASTRRQHRTSCLNQGRVLIMMEKDSLLEVAVNFLRVVTLVITRTVELLTLNAHLIHGNEFSRARRHKQTLLHMVLNDLPLRCRIHLQITGASARLTPLMRGEQMSPNNHQGRIALLRLFGLFWQRLLAIFIIQEQGAPIIIEMVLHDPLRCESLPRICSCLLLKVVVEYW